MGARWPKGGGGPPGPEPLDAGLSHEKARDCPALEGRGRRRVRRRGACSSARTWEPVRTAPLAQSQPATLPRDRWTFSLNALRSDGFFLEVWHRNCPSMERSGKHPPPSMTGVGVSPVPEHRLRAVATGA
jgi:hypothetical protein